MMRDERLTDVGTNEVVPMSVSLSSLLPHPLFDGCTHTLVNLLLSAASNST